MGISTQSFVSLKQQPGCMERSWGADQGSPVSSVNSEVTLSHPLPLTIYLSHRAPKTLVPHSVVWNLCVAAETSLLSVLSCGSQGSNSGAQT